MNHLLHHSIHRLLHLRFLEKRRIPHGSCFASSSVLLPCTFEDKALFEAFVVPLFVFAELTKFAEESIVSSKYFGILFKTLA
jgi:hypothetical protein